MPEYEVDISGYSVKFEKCQFVKACDDEFAEDEDSKTVLATKQFVFFRLCPDNSGSSCNYYNYYVRSYCLLPAVPALYRVLLLLWY
jgi:hypothetical protein